MCGEGFKERQEDVKKLWGKGSIYSFVMNLFILCDDAYIF